jgi:hypothetical protein
MKLRGERAARRNEKAPANGVLWPGLSSALKVDSPVNNYHRQNSLLDRLLDQINSL